MITFYYSLAPNPRKVALMLEVAAHDLEVSEGQVRVKGQPDRWIAVVPYWAAWPFETLVLPKQDRRRLPDLDAVDRDEGADGLAAGEEWGDGGYGYLPYSFALDPDCSDDFWTIRAVS